MTLASHQQGGAYYVQVEQAWRDAQIVASYVQQLGPFSTWLDAMRGARRMTDLAEWVVRTCAAPDETDWVYQYSYWQQSNGDIYFRRMNEYGSWTFHCLLAQWPTSLAARWGAVANPLPV